MAKNQNTPNLDNTVSSFNARFLELQSAFAGKGFWGKLTVSLLMILALFSVVLSVSYLLLSSVFSAVFAAMGDKTTTSTSKAVRKNNLKSYKSVANGKMVENGLDNATRSFVSSVGGKLDLEIHDNLAFSDRGVLRRYFKLLKIKDKSALELVKSSSCQAILDQYNKTHKSVRRLEQTINNDKVLKKAAKKAAAMNPPVYGPVVPPVTASNP